MVALISGNAKNTELLKRARDAITNDLLSSKWREKHPEVVHWLPYPLRKEYDPEVPEPEPLPVRDWTEFELRAWVEKRKWKADKDAEWHQRQQDVGRYVSFLCNLIDCRKLLLGSCWPWCIVNARLLQLPTGPHMQLAGMHACL